MPQPIKSIKSSLLNQKLVRFPQVVIEEHQLGKDTPLSVIYGKNYTCVIILPENTKLNNNMQERISILVNEKLD